MYTINLDTEIGGYFTVTNNTTVILQTNFTAAKTIATSGYKVDVGSKLIFENLGTYTATIQSPTYSYNSNISGEMQARGTNGLVRLDLMNFQPSFGASLNVFGTISLKEQAYLEATDVSLNMKAGSVLHFNTGYASNFAGNFDPASTINFTGTTSGILALLPGGGSYGNIVYDCPDQTSVCPLFENGNVLIKGNLIVKNTGIGGLAFLNNAPYSATTNQIMGDLVLQGASIFQLSNAGLSGVPLLLSVNGNTDIQSGELDVSNGRFGNANATLAVKGNFNNAGKLKATTNGATNNTVLFQGSSVQTVVPGTINDDLLSFEINNPAGVAMQSDWVLPSNTKSTLTLTNGNINMGSHQVNLKNPSPSAISGGSAASHIIGTLQRATNSTGTYRFPVSNSATESAEVELKPLDAANASFTVSFVRPNPYDRTTVPAGMKNAGNYVWHIDRMAGTTNADLSFLYGFNNFQSGNGNLETDLRVIHWNGTSWDNLGGSGAAGKITVTGVSSFSPFSLGTVGPIALPVNLVHFSGHYQDRGNLLQWTVAKETNLRAYEIQRSPDGRLWTTIGNVNSRGTSSGDRTYSFFDSGSRGGRLYYRLLCVDHNGNISISQSIMISAVAPDKFTVNGIFPNPAASFTTIALYSPEKDKVLMRLVDGRGKLLKTQSTTIEVGFNTVRIDVNDLPAGLYFIKLICSQNRQSAATSLLKQ